MGFYNVCTKRDIQYAPYSFSEKAEAWFQEWLDDHYNEIEQYKTQDKIEILDVAKFEKLSKEANPTENIRKEIELLFDCCIKNGKKLGTIYIDIF